MVVDYFIFNLVSCKHNPVFLSRHTNRTPIRALVRGSNANEQIRLKFTRLRTHFLIVWEEIRIRQSTNGSRECRVRPRLTCTFSLALIALCTARPFAL